MTVFPNIINISALNAYIIYNEIDPNWKLTKKHTKREYFLHKLAILLASPYMENRKQLPRNISSTVLLPKLSTKNVTDTDNNEAGTSKKLKIDKALNKNHGRCHEWYLFFSGTDKK